VKGKQSAKPGKAKGEAKCPVVHGARKSSGSRVHDLEKRLAEAQKREVEALEQQTATSEVLRVISQSPTDAQPVFDTIMQSAAALCNARNGLVLQFDGERLHFVAATGWTNVDDVRRLYPRRPDPETVAGRVVLQGAVVHIQDFETDLHISEVARRVALAHGARSGLGVPMVQRGKTIGVISLGKPLPEPFTTNQIAILQTFANQAVIAIENVRLFKELEARNRDLTEALEQQTATAEILRVISASPMNLQPVLDTVVQSAGRFCGANDAAIFLVDGGSFKIAAHHGPVPGSAPGRVIPVGPGSVSGRAVLERQAVHVTDLQAEPESFPVGSALARELGFRTVLSVPLLREGTAVGTLNLRRVSANPFTDKQVALLKTFADQAVIAVENVRLFKELESANRELGAASRHKSEFLANMSHELRTPLNAVIGFSEVLLQRMFGELNSKQDEYLKDIYASGQHLLSLINDILDLSKIEAGRMELVPAPFHLPTALENAVTLVRERAARHGIALELDLDPRLGELVGDERKVKQVLLNLLSNAVKFTPEGGRITVKAGRTDEAVEIAVSDTGIGIAPEDQAAIFEEFRQVGTDDARKLEGTGLGLTLAKKFVELHDGRIWVESELGRGSTFTFTLPVS
jgi:signal transduction histidine kinase